ncbi:DinB family protein [Chryseolinea sp. H1M3-3]|uniref:DinB family protein n=1 Tax=Chryseolinea sp. H1M3-3 TaxID=3034144 RepID=UPI0023EA7AE2|nr:DinB family protein [Chryseolinea sp. H1M3-3]
MNTRNTSLSQTVLEILNRDLNKVIQEIESYKNENHIWSLAGNIGNTGGNLALHIAGAINHFIGAVLGRNGYVRERDKEFSEKNITRDEILSKVKSAIETIHQVLPVISLEILEDEFPEKPGGKSMTTGFFMIHLVSHINYHLGQINYHRRLLDKNQ